MMAAEGKLGPCMQCVRCMLFVFNALFWVSKEACGQLIVCRLFVFDLQLFICTNVIS